MSDIGNLEGRITEALDRIRRGLAAQPAAGGDADLQAALDAERASNAELVQRVAILKDRQDTQVASLTARVETQRAQMLKLDAELQALRASNVQLRDMNATLRETVSPDMLNDAAAAEIAALQAQRSADAAEMDAIIAELKPLIEEAPHAAG
jgi:hypothetical protein